MACSLTYFAAAAPAKSLQSCSTLCDPRDRRFPRPWDSPGKNIRVGCHFLLQCVKLKSLSRVRLLATPWTAAHQAPPSMGFSRQEDWSGGATAFSTHLFSVQFSSVSQLCLTLCDPMNHSTPGLAVHHQLPKFTQTHVHQVSDAIQPSHPLSAPSLPAPNPSQHQGLFQ